MSNSESLDTEMIRLALERQRERSQADMLSRLAKGERARKSPHGRGTNGMKRRRRARIDRYIAEHRNQPGSGWKRAVRLGRL